MWLVEDVMRLPIETWIAETSLPEEALVSFREAIVAYKAGAYRAALLFSYLGWGLTLRARLLDTPGPPREMESGQWQKLLRDLRNEDRWDAQVFDCTQMKSPAPVFHVSDDIRGQVRYWKDRRNDCAHFKLNEIGNPHVESLWAFIRSNLGRFVPLGSEAALIAAIVRHFDPNVTSIGTDFAPLIKRISESMGPERFKPFLLDVRQALTTNFGKFKLTKTSEYNFILASCLFEQGRLGNAALELILEDHAALIGVLRLWPDATGYLSEHPEHVRELWRKDLFTKGHSDLGIYAGLLRNNLIPAEQLLESNSRAALHLQGDVPTEQDVDALSRAGFFNALRDVAFERNSMDQFAWGNTNAPIVAWYIERFPLDDLAVSRICDTFNSQHYPFAVEAALKQVLAANTAKRAEFIDVARRLGKPMPPAFAIGADAG